MIDINSKNAETIDKAKKDFSSNEIDEAKDDFSSNTTNKAKDDFSSNAANKAKNNFSSNASEDETTKMTRVRKRDLRETKKSKTTRTRDLQNRNENCENRILIYWSIDFALDFFEIKSIAFWMMSTSLLIWMMLMLTQKKLIDWTWCENSRCRRHILVWFDSISHKQHNEKSDDQFKKVIFD